MKVAAPPGLRPKVTGVIHGGSADRAGVRSGDVLIEVAGRPVTSGTWFAAVQQAVTPYGLLFRRPTAKQVPAKPTGASEPADVATAAAHAGPAATAAHATHAAQTASGLPVVPETPAVPTPKS